MSTQLLIFILYVSMHAHSEIKCPRSHTEEKKNIWNLWNFQFSELEMIWVQKYIPLKFFFLSTGIKSLHALPGYFTIEISTYLKTETLISKILYCNMIL